MRRTNFSGKRSAQLEEKLERVTDKLEKGNIPDFKPNKNQPKDSSNPGRKKGHQEESREGPPPRQVDEEKMLDPALCPQCGKSFQDQKPQEVRARYVEDILLPRPWQVRYETNRYYCLDCEEIVEEKPKDLPPDGRLGNKLRSYILYLREELACRPTR